MIARFFKHALFLSAKVFLLCSFLFFFVHAIATSPSDLQLAQWSTQHPLAGSEQLAEERRRLHVYYGEDKPLLVRYGHWVISLIRGDLGRSYFHHRLVSEALFAALAPSLWLGSIAFLLCHLCAFVLGSFAALSPLRVLRAAVLDTTTLLYCIPPFALGILLLQAHAYFFGYATMPLDALNPRFTEAPTLGSRFSSTVLPLFCYLGLLLPPMTNLVKDTLAQLLTEDFVRAARAKGASEWRIVRIHLVRPVILGLLPLWPTWASLFLGGAVTIETVFGIPGIGRLGYEAALAQDLPLLLGVIVLGVMGQVAAQAIADAMRIIVDPRGNCP